MTTLSSKKLLSSPGRTDNFPPPLMRFLRTNTGNKSRGRSRSTPIFFIRPKKNTTTQEEPSSPKVTCTGQVRVRRSAPKNRRLCQKKPFRRVFDNWGLFFGKVDSTEDSSRAYSNSKSGNFGVVAQEKRRDFVESSSSSSSSPPKNALILTRCRSAPYRSSSLGGRFWCSPLKEGDNEIENEEKSERISEKSEIELKGIAGGDGAVHPLVLTRCKSEPARIGERLNC
ncbi:hypothetical protein ACJIZ3_021953 [Penstemon smallii]|uniref:Uncharacterized protein n=1 Tax=Penstemon smallii TaxID=265156 RepID=A0ABD3SMV8_9LAMI